MGNFTISITMFNSYVKLPEGTGWLMVWICLFFKWCSDWCWLEHGWIMTFHIIILGMNFIIPTDELTPWFFRGVGGSTTNQCWFFASFWIININSLRKSLGCFNHEPHHSHYPKVVVRTLLWHSAALPGLSSVHETAHREADCGWAESWISSLLKDLDLMGIMKSYKPWTVNPAGGRESIPIGSVYGIYANIGGILMVNVTIYSIHRSSGIGNTTFLEEKDRSISALISGYFLSVCRCFSAIFLAEGFVIHTYINFYETNVDLFWMCWPHRTSLNM